MRAYLIDPVARRISEVDYDGDYHSIYRLCDYDVFTVATFDPNTQDGVFVDDEGLFKSPQNFFYIVGYPQPLAGKELVLGCDDEGESIEPAITLDDLRKRVVYLTREEALKEI